MPTIIAFPTPDLTRNRQQPIGIPAGGSTIMSASEMLAAAEELRDQMAEATEWLERVKRLLAEH